MITKPTYVKVLAGCTIAFALLIYVTQAQSAFVNSIESFSGTVMDTATWESFYPEGMYQNNALYISTTYNSEYTTRFHKIAVGETVRTALTLTGRRSSGDDVAVFALSSNTMGIAKPHFQDSSYISITLIDKTSFGQVSIEQGGNGSGRGQVFYNPNTTIINDTFILEMERLSSSRTAGRIYDSSHTLLGSKILSHNPVPEALYINLFCSGYSRWDYVTIPEPSSLALLLTATLGGLFLWRRRR